MAILGLLYKSILQRLGKMIRGDGLSMGEIGDRASDTNHSMEGARRQMKSLRRSLEQASAFGVQRRDFFQFGTGQRRVDARSNCPRQLALSRREDSRAHEAAPEPLVPPLPDNANFAGKKVLLVDDDGRNVFTAGPEQR